MTLNPDKCFFGKEEIPFWEMIISKEGLKPDPEKVSALTYASRPRSKDELHSFLCMVQSNKDFIPNVASKTINLRKRLRKHHRFRWNKECQREFEDLKDAFREDTLLTLCVWLIFQPTYHEPRRNFCKITKRGCPVSPRIAHYLFSFFCFAVYPVLTWHMYC